MSEDIDTTLRRRHPSSFLRWTDAFWRAQGKFLLPVRWVLGRPFGGYLAFGLAAASRSVEAPPAERFMHAATYSGHPTCCAVGLRNLEVFEREGLVERTAPAVGIGGKVLSEARKRGLITRIRAGQAGEHPIGDTICLAPPLVVTDAQVDRIVEVVREAIRAVSS